ncbi:MAG: hypothetical protein E7551_03160 [Ruminococcaceae bacterium]|nr:hypothetical protein [Oscillospiraceae bacterium]
MGKSKRDRSKYFKYAALVFVIIFFISGALLLLRIWDKQQGEFPVYESEEIAIEFGGKEYVLKENIESFLVIGLDKKADFVSSDSYINDQSADFLMLFVFDNTSKKFSAIQINRDTMTDVNILGVNGNKIDSTVKQIALAHTYGNGKEVSCRNTMDAVSGLLLDSKVNHYISFALDSVLVFNDLVGGVELTVLDDFTGVDDTLQKGQTVTLTNEQALKYVQSRKGLEEDDNLSRMERQKQFVNALYNKTLQAVKKDENFTVDASLKLAEYIVSDRSVTQLREFANKFTEYEFLGICDINGESKKGEEFMEFYADIDSVTELVVETFYKLKG